MSTCVGNCCHLFMNMLLIASMHFPLSFPAGMPISSLVIPTHSFSHGNCLSPNPCVLYKIWTICACEFTREPSTASGQIDHKHRQYDYQINPSLCNYVHWQSIDMSLLYMKHNSFTWTNVHIAGELKATVTLLCTFYIVWQ